MGDLTEHFDLADTWRTDHDDLRPANRAEARKWGANIATMAALAEEAHAILDEPMIVNSWGRGVALNRRVKGQPTSQHCQWLAIDFRVKDIEAAYQKLLAAGRAGEIRWGQLLQEGTWLHISSPKGRDPARCMEYGRKDAGGKVHIEGRIA